MADLERKESEAREGIRNLNQSVDVLNQTFAGTFQAVNDVYLRFSDPIPQFRNIDLSTGVGTNRDVFAVLKSDETFHPYRFTAAPAQVTQAGSPGPLISEAPNPNLNVVPANLPQNISKSFEFEMHKFWHANIVAGFVFSSIADVDFTTKTKNVQQHGEQLEQTVATYGKHQRPSVHYLLGFNYYLSARDTYPRLRRSIKQQWTPGILGGIGLESTKNFFVGPNFEPVLGVDLSIGLHYGEQKALPLGTVLNETPLPGGNLPSPRSSKMKAGVYVMIGFDLNIFRRFMGAAAPGQ